MKSKLFISCIAIVIIIIVLTQFNIKGSNADISWIKDLNYEESQVYDISFGFFNPCPSIPVNINGKEVKLLFDTGNGEGIALITAIKGEVDYEIIGKTTELNADGTYRGDANTILLKSVNVFDERYLDVKLSLSDWKMYGFFKDNGMIGLEYFRNKVVTLDYKNKKIAVSSKALDYSKLKNDKYMIIPLINSSSSNKRDLLFFQGEVNGEKSTIYLDTGASRSFLNLENSEAGTVDVKLGDKNYKFNSNKLKHEAIGFKDKFEYPLRLAINSDILKSNHFVITIDKIQNNLIIHQD